MATDNVHVGHRARMRRKLVTHTARVFDTYEILEMLLYYVVSHKDTNPIAKNLLSRFGGIDGVLSASEAELMEVEGVGPRVAAFLSDVGRYGDAVRTPKSDALAREIVDYKSAGRYFVEYFRGKGATETVMLSLDNRMNIISFDKVYDIDLSSGAVKERRFLEIAIRNRAAVVIIAHNHLYGTKIPTEGDRAGGEFIGRALGLAGIVLAENYIVAGEEYLGFVNHLGMAFSQKPELKRFIESKEGAAYEKC